MNWKDCVAIPALWVLLVLIFCGSSWAERHFDALWAWATKPDWMNHE